MATKMTERQAEKARQVEIAKQQQDLPRFVGAQDIQYIGGTAYIDERAALHLFAYTHKTDKLVNGVVPIYLSRKVVLAYLKNFPLTAAERKEIERA